MSSETLVTISFTCNSYVAGLLMALNDVLNMPIERRDFSDCGSAGKFEFVALAGEVIGVVPAWAMDQQFEMGWGTTSPTILQAWAETLLSAASDVAAEAAKAQG